MAVNWTRIETRSPRPTTAALARRVDLVLTAFGQIGNKEIRERIWNTSRFKNPTGRSTNAWTFKRADWSGKPAIMFENLATNKYGTKYARYVHLAGRPKSQKLMREVVDYALGDLGPRIGRAVAYAFVDERRKTGVKTTKTTLKG